MAEAPGSYLVLPVSIISRIDIGRLLREVEALDNFLRQALIRDPEAKVVLPRTSLLFEEIVSANKLNILQESDRTRLAQFLRSIKEQAPVLHMSFSADPSPLFLKRLTSWLRKEIHPLVLVRVGLQPNIGAGCVMRSTNKQFDFSLRQRFIDKRGLLMQSLHGAVQAPPQSTTVVPGETHPS